jgi:hypothetical protein
MKKGVEITIWIVAVSIPIISLIVGVKLLVPPKPQSDPSTDDTSVGQSTSPEMPASASTTCGSEAIPCDLGDADACSVCGGGFVCTNVGANDTNYNVEGTYCLPAQPDSACSRFPVDHSEHMQGRFRWTGWAGVNVQNWQCDCPYPQYYPMDTTLSSADTGACKRSSALCRNGVWKYPCVRKVDEETGEIIPDQCEDLSPEEEDALAGTDPLQNGLCSCKDVPCVDDGDCAGDCMGGVCVNQRLSMSPTLGVPECVRDTCVGEWEILPVPPYIYGHCVDQEG